MRTLIAANWKMYKTRAEATQTACELVNAVPVLPADRQVLVFAPFTALDATVQGFGTSGVAVGAQDLYPAAEGAFTGEVSPAMIKDTGASWVLTGHSERRHILGESEELVGQKTAFALAEGLSVVLCIGETLAQREAGQLESVLRLQLETSLRPIDTIDPLRLAVAYEPVWAIGTGKVASPADILEAHALVRGLLREIIASNAENIAILYGGSVKPENATAILALDNVNGLLVGGASLQASNFSRIILA